MRASSKQEEQKHGFNLSQEAINEIEQEAETEVAQEKQRLISLAKQKKDFVEALKMQSNTDFRQKQEQTK